MKTELLKLFWSEFRKRRKKTALITFAIFWGTLSILLLMSFGRGLTTQSRISFKGLGDNLIMIGDGRTTKDFQGLPKGRRIRLYAEDVDLLRRLIPEIALIGPESFNGDMVRYKSNEANRTVHGVFSEFAIMRNQIAASGGRFINADDEKNSRRVAFLGWQMAATLFAGENPLGQKIYINRTPFTVIGILQKKFQNSMYNGPDAEQAYIPFSTYAQINSQQYLDYIHIQPASQDANLLVDNRVREILGRKYRFAVDDEYAINVWNTIKVARLNNKIFTGIEIFLGLIGFLTLLIGAVGVTNLMYAVVKERTREIGIKMALGAKRRHIVLQFFLETLFVFSKGALWGGLIAFNIVSLVRTIPISYDGFGIEAYLLRPEFASDILLVFLSILGILVFFSGIFPALRASRLNPVESLRYE